MEPGYTMEESRYYGFGELVYRLDFTFPAGECNSFSEYELPAGEPDVTVRFLQRDALPEVCRELTAQVKGGFVTKQGGVFHRYYRGSPIDRPDRLVACLTMEVDKTFAQVEILKDLPLGEGFYFKFFQLEHFLLNKKGVILHASFVEEAGEAVLFSGPSGAGKSTQAALWSKRFGCPVRNGDRALLRWEQGSWIVYGTFYAGTSGISRKCRLPLKALLLIEQNDSVTLKKATPGEAFRRLLSQTAINAFIPGDAERASDILTNLALNAPIYKLGCRADNEGVEKAHALLYI